MFLCKRWVQSSWPSYSLIFLKVLYRISIHSFVYSTNFLSTYYVLHLFCSKIHVAKIHQFNHFKVHNSVAFHTFTVLCNPQHSLVREHIHQPKRKTHTLQAVTLFLSPYSPWQPLSYFLSVWICLLLLFFRYVIIYSVAFVFSFFHLA